MLPDALDALGLAARRAPAVLVHDGPRPNPTSRSRAQRVLAGARGRRAHRARAARRGARRAVRRGRGSRPRSRRPRRRRRGARRRCFSTTGESLAEAVLRDAREAGLTIATAESCTGGMVAAALTDVPGASDVFLGGVVSYSERAQDRRAGRPARHARAVRRGRPRRSPRAMAEGVARADAAPTCASRSRASPAPAAARRRSPWASCGSRVASRAASGRESPPLPGRPRRPSASGRPPPRSTCSALELRGPAADGRCARSSRSRCPTPRARRSPRACAALRRRRSRVGGGEVGARGEPARDGRVHRRARRGGRARRAGRAGARVRGDAGRSRSRCGDVVPKPGGGHARMLWARFADGVEPAQRLAAAIARRAGGGARARAGEAAVHAARDARALPRPAPRARRTRSPPRTPSSTRSRRRCGARRRPLADCSCQCPRVTLMSSRLSQERTDVRRGRVGRRSRQRLTGEHVFVYCRGSLSGVADKEERERMEREKVDKILDLTKEQVERKFGKGSLMRLGEHANIGSMPAISTGSHRAGRRARHRRRAARPHRRDLRAGVLGQDHPRAADRRRGAARGRHRRVHRRRARHGPRVRRPARRRHQRRPHQPAGHRRAGARDLRHARALRRHRRRASSTPSPRSCRARSSRARWATSPSACRPAS